MQKYTFDLENCANISTSDSIQVAVLSELGEEIKADMYVTNNVFNKTLLTYGRQEFFVRVFKEGDLTLMKTLENFSLRINPKKKRRVTLLFTLNPKAVNFDSLVKTGDYVEKSHMNCYMTEKLISPKGASLSFMAKSSNFNIYLNPNTLPKNKEDFAYKYQKGDFVIVPASVNSLGINLPLQPFQVNQKGPTYFCVEARDDPLAFAVGYSQWIPYFLQPGQKQKIYLHDLSGQMAFTHMPRFNQNPMQINLHVAEGCVNLIAKRGLSFYQGYSYGEKLMQGSSPFTNPEEEDLVWNNLKPKQGNNIIQLPRMTIEGVCGGNDIYVSCPTFFFIENCEKDKSSDSIVTMEISNHDEIQITPGDRMITKIQNDKQYFMIPNVPPLATSVKIAITISKNTNENDLGIASVSRKSVATDPTKGERINKLTNTTKKYYFNFTKQNDGDLSGNYFITIEGHSDFNIRIFAKAVEGIGKEKKHLQNIKHLPSKEYYSMAALNMTHQIGYFNFFLNNTDLQGNSNKHDILISATLLKDIESLKLTMTTDKYYNSTDITGHYWTGETIRLKANDHIMSKILSIIFWPKDYLLRVKKGKIPIRRKELLLSTLLKLKKQS